MLACGHDAAAQSPFFEDKTIRLVLGFSPGGISDLWGRALARGMSQHIPGKPNIILQNMPGAGSLTAANYIYGITGKHVQKDTQIQALSHLLASRFAP